VTLARTVADMLDPGMGACSNCGVIVLQGDRFCNACGTPIGHGGSPAAPTPPAPLPYVAPIAQPQHLAAPETHVSAPQAPRSVTRCQLGHEIVRGTSYCSLGHPIALDQMQFANELYGPQGGQASAIASHFSPQPVPARAHYPAQPAQPPPPPAPSGPSPSIRPAAPREAPPHMLRGFLIAYGRNPNGDFWPLTGGRHTIGRLGSSDGIEIPIQDPTVSSRHATLNVDPATGSIVVEDAGSTNGTFVNDEPVGRGGWRELSDGDRLRVGGFTTVVKVIGPI
jgi:FHA domain